MWAPIPSLLISTPHSSHHTPHTHFSHRRLTKLNRIITLTILSTMATATAETPAELKTYWCHECDMSVSLTRSPTPSPLLCPHCNTHFLELMDSPLNDTEPPLQSSLFDVVFQDAINLLSPPPPKPRAAITILPVITVTTTLLSNLDPNGVVFCAVCKDLISVDSEAKQLPCEHLYHSDCITPWLEVQSSCPLCRFRLEEEEEEEEEEGPDEDEIHASAMRRQLVMRLSEMSEDDFWGLRITLNHIASRHASGAAASQIPESAGENDGGGVDGE